ncbi:MAG: CBS domain-containing protein [Desulfobacterales bacterium]|nr:CBS domain-containing protein [Desulfobacterales bacterium]MDJ0912381.1 CBS domain-containing protein [Desulfobacterales bacterium]
MVDKQKGEQNPAKKLHAITTGSQEMMAKVPRIKDVMTEDPVTFRLGMTVHDAAKRLLQKSIVAAPVVDADDNFVGMFSQQGCMVGLVDGVYDEVPQPIFVDDYLEPVAHTLTIAENEPIMNAVSKFASQNQIILSLPVLREGKVVGIIARQDIIRTFFEMTARFPEARAAILYISGLEKEQQDFEKLR